jgi:glycosyltransferase involved in cell wall biosynthesis
MPVAGKTVCILTSSHDATDDRAFHKEAVSLAKAGYDVVMVGQHDRAETVEGVRIVPLPASTSRFRRYFGNNWRCLLSAFRIRAAVYHFHDPELLPVGVLLRLAGKRVIYDVHEDYHQDLLSRPMPRLVRWLVAPLWRLWEKSAARVFNHVIAADSHIQSKFPADRTTLIGNFVPLRFGQALRGRQDDGTFRVVYVGGVTVQRGIAHAAKAMTLVGSDAIEFHVAGPASDAELAKRLSQQPKIIYHGCLPWPDVAALLADGDVGLLLLQPVSTYVYCAGEGIVKLYEYMSVGLPVLVSNFPKLKALIERLDAGMAVDPTSPEAIARAIEFLHENPAVRRRMGDNGRRAVREQFNWEHEEQKLLAIYHKLTAGRE